MTARRLILQSARFYWRTHLGVILGAALATIVLTGSLLVGDSVKATLRRQALDRVGKADVALVGGDRFFRAALADDLAGGQAPALILRGSVTRPDGASRVNQAQVLGVDDRFWDLAPSGGSRDSDRPRDLPHPAGRAAVPSAVAGILPATPGGVAAREPETGTGPSASPPRSATDADPRLDAPGRIPGAAVGTPALPDARVSPSHGGFPDARDARIAAAQPGAETVDLNARMAQQLGVAVGDTVIVRVEKPGFFSKDAPLSGEENEVVAIRAKVGRLITDAEFGRFALQASQVPPATVFLPLEMLQQRLAFAGRVNLLLRQFNPGTFGSLSKDDRETARQNFHHFVSKDRTLEDVSLETRAVATGGVELRTPRVFLDPAVVAAAPRGGVDALTYFVNELRAGDKAVPYSMVTALDAAASGFLPAELSDNEIVINQWLAEQLGVGLNQRISMKYFVMGERRELTEQTREFEIIQILPMDEPQLNSSWMPDFPGLSDKENCRDWQPGFALDESRIRDEDEAYWKQYRGTPKAFVNISLGQRMWGNRWGSLTAIRYAAPMTEPGLARQILAKLTPEQAGLSFVPLREQALAATEAPVDFGELFVSFSFFLIAAAAVLTGLLFVFSLEQRNAEAGLLLALGLRPKQVRRWFLAEGAVLALVGSVLGAAGAVVYTKVVLRALASVWRGAVGAVDFEFATGAATLPIGVISGVLIALLAMWLASRRQLRHTARELLTGEVAGSRAVPPACLGGRLDREPGLGRNVLGGRLEACPTTRGPIVIALVAFTLAAGLPFIGSGPGIFFGSGSLLLIGGLALALLWLRRLAAGAGDLGSVCRLGTRNAARRRGRSLATIGVLASGVFMVVAVDSFRKKPPRDGDPSDSGTGGFALVAESALPIYEDLNSAKGREAYGLGEETMRGVRIVQMRVHDGDDASCLNLNKALQPRLLGVNAAELGGRFRFGGKLNESDPDSFGWNSIAGVGVEAAPDGAVPGIVDANTLQWALKLKLGDTLDYRDDRGAVFKVRLVGTVSGSILQGSVLIAESRLVEKFPDSGGYRFFLIEAGTTSGGGGSVEAAGSNGDTGWKPPATGWKPVPLVRAELSRALADRGLEVVTTAQRLAELQAVENTYLSIFQALGGLGLLLGSAGLAIVVARNVLERRREFGLLAAVGFRPRQLRQLVFAEHRWLIAAALIIGTLSALVAVWPNLAQKAGGFPLREVALLLAALTLGCLFWIWIATRLALRGSSVDALRSE